MKFENYESARNAMWQSLIDDMRISDNGFIVLFGCGWMGTELLKYLNSDILRRIVSLCDNNSASWGLKKQGFVVRSPKETVDQYPKALYIVAIARDGENVKNQLVSYGIPQDSIKVFKLNDDGVAIRRYLSERLSMKYVMNEDFPSEAAVPVVRSKDPKDNRDFRISIDKGLGNSLDAGKRLFDESVMDEYEKHYGKYRLISDYSVGNSVNTVRVMIARSHMDYAKMEEDDPEIYIPVQAGAALSDTNLCKLKDNDGISVSERNYNYCECSVLYWAWQNGFAADTQYLGLRQYRRRFEATSEQLFHLNENNIDIVHLDPVYHEDIRDTFSFHTKNENDWDVMKEAIHSVFPQYDSAMEEYENQHFVVGYNMNILRRHIFDEYCEFLFGVLFYIEDYYMKIYDRKDRYLGFLAENLFGVFLIKNKDKYEQAITKLIPYIKY